MKDIVSCIEELRLKLDRHRKEYLKEYPTRTIFIDPLLEALGWEARGSRARPTTCKSGVLYRNHI
ncbi:MAG: hypothetical protein JRI37_15415 [Deltaproteobacteria bacterium]|nr:hypothetical protein [Deltaproteobacteria bacterium]